jgi:FRG domain
MAQIKQPTNDFDTATSVHKLLDIIARWRREHNDPSFGYHSRAWYRGQGNATHEMQPGVYRKPFTDRAKDMTPPSSSLEDKRLKLERESLNDFRTAGAPHFNANDGIEVYFTAQHYGMQTRLLDWTANPLAALFFAVTYDPSDTGAVFVMEPAKLLPEHRKQDDLWPHILSMRHPYAKDAIAESFWHKHSRKPLILPIRPDNQYGRIGQQGSCFTLHMHNSKSTENPTLSRIKIPSDKKKSILDELHRLNVNQFTIYNDLERLSKEIRRTWHIDIPA